MLADFRAWLTTAASAEPPPAAEVIDLSAVVGHFTALRHEVNLLTKTTRAAVEQNADTLKLLQPAAKRPPAYRKLDGYARKADRLAQNRSADVQKQVRDRLQAIDGTNTLDDAEF